MVGYQEVEDRVSNLFQAHIGQSINIPQPLMNSLGIQSKEIVSVDPSIAKKHNSKTDVLVLFRCGGKLKISVKKDNAHYYGNWYTHQRVEEEFGFQALERLVEKTTKWANDWINNERSNFFLGVSINFGSRTGNTFLEFNEIFDPKDIRTIVAGHDPHADTTANVIFNSNGNTSSIDQVLQNLEAIDDALLNKLFSEVKIVFRPINPMTEGSNRGKQTYTKFILYESFHEETLVEKKEDLRKLGKFVEVDLKREYKLNHNSHLRSLNKLYGMKVNVKC